MKTITLRKTGYRVKGISDLTLWGGENSSIMMKEFSVKNISKENLKKNLNDNGFGVESINGAICDIYENYEGTLRYLKTKTVGKVSERTEKHYEEYYHFRHD